MSLGDLVKVTIEDTNENEIQYLAKIVAYNKSTSKYLVSIDALGKVEWYEASDLDDDLGAN